jgi:hypothetical protein
MGLLCAAGTIAIEIRAKIDPANRMEMGIFRIPALDRPKKA